MSAVRHRGVWLLLAALLLVALRLPGFRIPMDQDTGCYAYVGWTWATGGLPYRDAWDHKPPAIYLIPATLTAAVGEPTANALRACSVGLGVGTLLLVFAISRRLFDEAVGLAAAAVYAVASSGVLMTRETLETEQPMVFFCLLAVWLMVVADRRWRWWVLALAGLSAGASMMFKPVSAPVLGLAFLWLVGRQWAGEAAARRTVQAAALVGGGVVAVPAAFAGYFAAVGILGDVRGAMAYNFVYQATAEHAGVVANARLFLSNVTYSRLREFGPEQAWLVLLAGVGFLVALVRWRGPGLVLQVLWVVGAGLGVVGAGRFYAYYFVPLCAALAPLGGVAAVWVVRGLRSARPWPAKAGLAGVAALVVAALAAGVWRDVKLYRQLVSPQHTNVMLARLAKTIRSDTERADCIFVWGTRQQVYVQARRRAPTRYTYDAPFRDREAARRFFGEGIFEELAQAVRAGRCPYVLVTDLRALEGFDALADLLASDYREVAREQRGPMVTCLYRRREATEAGEAT
ncbi:MAG: ArnT family glycosyltransferase [Candidatus Brocadiia bacterium]